MESAGTTAPQCCELYFNYFTVLLTGSSSQFTAWVHRVLVSICLGRGNLFCSSSLPQVKGSELGIQCKLHETGSGSDRDLNRPGGSIGPQMLILREKTLYLLWGAADKGGRIQERIQLMLGEAEFRLPGQAGEQIAGETFPHDGDRLHGAATDQLMQLLAVAAAFDALHQKVFRGNEGEILPDTALDDLLIHAETGTDVVCQMQNRIRAEEGLRHGETAVGRVIQGALQPLGGGGERCVHRFCHQVTGEGADPLAAHGVALVGHGGRTDLAVLKGLFQLAVMLQEADVLGHAVTALGNGTQGIQDTGIGLAGVGLATDREAGGKTEFFGQHFVHPVDLPAVAVEQIQKTRLGPGGAAAAEETEASHHEVQFLEIRDKVLHPERGPFPDGDQLGRLIMGVPEGGERLVPIGKFRQNREQGTKLTAQHPQAFAIENQVPVVGHIAAGGAEMDDPRRRRRGFSVGIDVRHHVVADFLFPAGDAVKVNIAQMGLQVAELFLRDREAELMLRLCQSKPQPAPGLGTPLRGEELLHADGSIASDQGRLITVIHGLFLVFI